LKEELSPAISDIDFDTKSKNSENSKSIDDSSITTSTKVPGKDDHLARHEIKVVDSLTINTFVKLSDF
jgi:hypothetical protein